MTLKIFWKKCKFMLHKYRLLLQHSERRLQAGQRRLNEHCQMLKREQRACQRLKDELEFQEKLSKSSPIDGVSASRQQLFSWLRKTAADRRRTHALRVDLQHQQGIVEDCTQKLEAERSLCHQLAGRCHRYQMLLKQEWRKARLRKVCAEEYEIEERFSWLK